MQMRSRPKLRLLSDWLVQLCTSRSSMPPMACVTVGRLRQRPVGAKHPCDWATWFHGFVLALTKSARPFLYVQVCDCFSAAVFVLQSESKGDKKVTAGGEGALSHKGPASLWHTLSDAERIAQHSSRRSESTTMSRSLSLSFWRQPAAGRPSWLRTRRCARPGWSGRQWQPVRMRACLPTPAFSWVAWNLGLSFLFPSCLGFFPLRFDS